MVAAGNGDGTANLCGYRLPTDRVADTRAHIETLTRAARSPPDEHTPDQHRADIFSDLLSGTPTTSSRPARGVVDTTVDLHTLAEPTDQPGHIPGFGPVIADITRQPATEHGPAMADHPHPP